MTRAEISIVAIRVRRFCKDEKCKKKMRKRDLPLVDTMNIVSMAMIVAIIMISISLIVLYQYTKSLL